MRIHFERSGGFAGITLTADVDSDQLPAAEADSLSKLIDQADFFNLPKKPKASSQGADQFQYNIRVETPSKSHEIQVGDGSVPPKLKPLIDRLLAESRKPKN
jgi:hypothetical protein